MDKRLRTINSAGTPSKYSTLLLGAHQDRRLVEEIRRTMNLPPWVYDEMIHRQLSWCKFKKMSIEEAKAHLLRTYIDDINGNVEDEVKQINAKVMEGLKSAYRS